MQLNSRLDNETPPKCDMLFPFLSEIQQSISKSGFTRTAIIERMNEALGGEIVVTDNKFNKWLAPSCDNQIPMIYVPALCWALKDTSIIDALLKPIHFRTIDQRGVILQQAAEHQIESQKHAQLASQMIASVSA